MTSLPVTPAALQCDASPNETLLVSSPGYGVLDSGCGKTIVGLETLKDFMLIWEKNGTPCPEFIEEVNHFRYGNGEKEASNKVIQMPVSLAGRVGTIRVAVVQGHAPLLVSRRALQLLKAVVDFDKQELRVFDEQRVIPLSTNSAGQFVVDLRPATPDQSETFDEVMVAAPFDEPDSPAASTEAPLNDSVTPSGPLQTWVRHDSYFKQMPTLGKQGPYWRAIRRRIVKDSTTGRVLADEMIDRQRGTIIIPFRPKFCA